MDLLAFSTDVVPKVGSSFTPGWMLDVCRTSDAERDGDADRPTLEGIFALEVAGSLVASKLNELKLLTNQKTGPKN